jgi:hypothetical protein
MLGSWDGYAGNSNNFYLYRDQVSGRFEYIPYILENSAGIDFLGADWSGRSIYNWNLKLAPLYTKILALEECKGQFTSYIKSPGSLPGIPGTIRQTGPMEGPGQRACGCRSIFWRGLGIYLHRF